MRRGREKERNKEKNRGEREREMWVEVLIATAAGAMVQRHRIAILTARNVYNFDNVSNNLFLSGNTLRGQFHPLVSLPSSFPHPLRYPWLIAKFAPGRRNNVPTLQARIPHNRVIMSIIRPRGGGKKGKKRGRGDGRAAGVTFDEVSFR